MKNIFDMGNRVWCVFNKLIQIIEGRYEYEFTLLIYNKISWIMLFTDIYFTRTPMDTSLHK